MRLSRSALILGAAIVSSSLMAPSAYATADNNPCKVLTAEKFGEIMGYAATVDKTGSNETSCFYQGPSHSGGQFMILTRTASGPQAEAMLNSRGSSPPAGSGLIGGSYRQGGVIFSVSIRSVSIRSTDQSKLQALVADVRRNLK